MTRAGGNDEDDRLSELAGLRDRKVFEVDEETLGLRTRCQRQGIGR
jgi:hypothetical protein